MGIVIHLSLARSHGPRHIDDLASGGGWCVLSPTLGATTNLEAGVAQSSPRSRVRSICRRENWSSSSHGPVGCRPTPPSLALSARLVLQLAKNEEIKLGGSHLAQVFSGKGHDTRAQLESEYPARIRCWKDGHRARIHRNSCAYMIQEPALTVSRPPVAQVSVSPRSLSSCRAMAAPILIVLQFAEDDQIKLGGNHSAQVLLRVDSRKTGQAHIPEVPQYNVKQLLARISRTAAHI